MTKYTFKMILIGVGVFLLWLAIPEQSTDATGFLLRRAATETVESVDGQLSSRSVATSTPTSSAPAPPQDLLTLMLLEGSGSDRGEDPLDRDPEWFPPGDGRGRFTAPAEESESEWWENGEHLGPPSTPPPTIGGQQVAAPCQPNDCEPQP